ncbi:MAG: nicotinate-nucleotide adenylyltransferase [Thioploca sp.]|nr:nicotinate-nucleotide adenylyltransferase [Thioploca sp.]
MILENTIDKAIGILGGTFDPIHHGHLRVAIELYERLDLAEVRLIPAARPPHRNFPAASAQLRLQMLQAAIVDTPGLIVDDRELHRSGPSYMVDTLSSLREEYPQRSLCLILGMDAFINLPQWYQWQRLITLAHLLVVHRLDTQIPSFSAMQDFLSLHQTNCATHLKKRLSGCIWIEPIPFLNISATQIRYLIAAGKNPRYLLPLAVLDLINTYQLYS